MNNSCRAVVVALLAIACSTTLFAQTENAIWQITNNRVLDAQSQKDRLLPRRFQAFTLTDPLSLKNTLSEAPLRFSEAANTETVTIDLPMPDGQTERFRVFASPVFHPELAAKFPNIKSYSGVSLRHPGTTVKFDLSQKGFHAMVFAIGENPIFVDPVDLDQQLYIVYYKKDFRHDGKTFSCSVTGKESVYEPESIITPRAGDCQLRRYRLALACTGEYAQYHDDGDDSNGDIVADALAAMNTSMTRVNGIFEKDAAITMQIVANNEDIIYTNPSTDPYTNGSGGAMLGQNQTTCDAVIGTANYDIGHVYSTGGGGVASLFSPCNNSSKARGVTGQNSPEGDPFDVDYVAHEMGHQYGGRHTQNNSCNRDGNASYEPGSASTIMGYAGICNPNVQSNSDDYFHASSIQSFGAFTTGSGNVCASIINSSNNPPTANAGSNYSIPVSTPFVLTGVGTDVDGDALTYCWEQWDREVAETMPPASTNTQGPAFRSFDPVSSPERYFPRLSVLAGSGTDTWEVLPSVGRDMDFRLTVRDNNSAYGCTEEDDMRVTTVASAGPFVITSPNSEQDWDIGTNQTITWDVANTTAAPVSCANVDILYSTDGGLSFPNTLVSNVPNDGSHTIVVPSVATSQFRIMVKCSDNIFFDISDDDITIGVQTVCVQFSSTDVPVSISSSGTPTITSDLSVALGENIVGVRVLDLEGTHSYLGDLRFTLIDPAGTEVVLINRECGNNDDFDVNINDSGGALSCPYNDDQTTSPVDPLSTFNGNLPDGTWVLEIADLANQDGGELISWSLEICYEELLAPLPLDFISFNATPQAAHIDLDWKTENEVNNQGFSVERSLSPQDGFTTIGWVDGRGDVLAANYQFADRQVIPGQKYYYRLKQMDWNGDHSYSKIVQAELPVEDVMVQIYPNPVNEQMTVILSADTQQKGQLQIIDLLGRSLAYRDFEVNGQTTQLLDVSTLPDGVYFLAVTLDGQAGPLHRFVKR